MGNKEITGTILVFLGFLTLLLASALAVFGITYDKDVKGSYYFFSLIVFLSGLANILFAIAILKQKNNGV